MKRLGYSRRDVLTFLVGVVLIYAFLHGWLDIQIGF